VLDLIATPTERNWAGAWRPPGAGAPRCRGRLLFTAKEAVYKAWYPLAGRFLDFHEVELTSVGRGTFQAELAVAGPMVNGRPLREFTGCWAAAGGFVVAAVAVPAC
jgi:4'-phosphopantetheinyl transferase EntD